MILPQTLSVSGLRSALDTCATQLRAWSARSIRQRTRRRSKSLTSQCDSLEPRQLLTGVAVDYATVVDGVLSIHLEGADGQYCRVDLDQDQQFDGGGYVVDGVFQMTAPGSTLQVDVSLFSTEQSSVPDTSMSTAVSSLTASLDGVQHNFDGTVTGNIFIPAGVNKVSLIYRLPGSQSLSTLWEYDLTNNPQGHVSFSVDFPPVSTDTTYEFAVRSLSDHGTLDSLWTTCTIVAHEDPFI